MTREETEETESAERRNKKKKNIKRRVTLSPSPEDGATFQVTGLWGNFLLNGKAAAYYRYSVPHHSTPFHSGDTPRLPEHQLSDAKDEIQAMQRQCTAEFKTQALHCRSNLLFYPRREIKQKKKEGKKQK